MKRTAAALVLEAEAKKPLAAGAAVTTRCGDGVIESLDLKANTITIELEHRTVTLKGNRGRSSKHGPSQVPVHLKYRVKRQGGSLRPEQRQQRSDTVSQEVIDAVEAHIEVNCPTSPCASDMVRRWLGPMQWEEARRMFRFETWNELWSRFRTDYPAVSQTIANPNNIEECPWGYRNSVPWQVGKGGGASCLCANCEAMEKLSRTRNEAGRVIRATMKADEEEAAEVGLNTAGDAGGGADEMDIVNDGAAAGAGGSGGGGGGGGGGVEYRG